MHEGARKATLSFSRKFPRIFVVVDISPKEFLEGYGVNDLAFDLLAMLIILGRVLARVLKTHIRVFFGKRP